MRFRLGWLFLLMVAAALGFKWAKERFRDQPPLREPFSVALLEKYRHEGRPVLVHVYAPWGISSNTTRRWLDQPVGRQVLASRDVVLLEYDLGPGYSKGYPAEVLTVLLAPPGASHWLSIHGGIAIFPVGPSDREPLRLNEGKEVPIAINDLLKAIDRATHWP